MSRALVSHWLLVLISAGVVQLSASGFGAPLDLARDGKALVAITLPSSPTPTEEFAAAELAGYLGKITGAHFEVQREKALRGATIDVRTEPDRAKPADSYSLAQRNGAILVRGSCDRATLYGVYDLLERMGCRWLAPGLPCYLGAHEVVPNRPNLALELPDAVHEAPALKFRKIYVEEGRSHDEASLRAIVAWMPKLRFNTLVVPTNYQGHSRVMWDNWKQALTPELKRRGLFIEVGGHGYQNYLNAQMEGGELFKKHPEWFAQDKKGKRRPEANWVFCTSNPEAVAFITHQVISYLHTHPEIEIFDFWPPDGAAWCECTSCTAFGSPADRQALLLNAVQEKVSKTMVHPVRLECIAYAAALDAPSKAKLNEGILVDFCPISQNFDLQINDTASTGNAKYVHALNQWRGSFDGDISIYSYYRKYAWRSLPLVIPHYMQNDLTWYAAVPVQGVSTYAEPGDWAAYELNHYMLGRLAWKPDEDVERLEEEFCSGRYGEAKKAGLQALHILEGTVRTCCSVPHSNPRTSETLHEGNESLKRSLQQLQEAQCACKDKVLSASLERLALSTQYALRDTEIQIARQEKLPAEKVRELEQALGRFLEQNRQAGVFVVGSRAGDKQTSGPAGR